MAKIIVKNLSKKYSSRQALKNVSFEIENGELTVITGLKESGKTTLIRAICGLDAVETGEVFSDGVLINKTEPKDRNMALVAAYMPLNPNASVTENVATGMKLRKFPKEEIESKTAKALEILGLSDYAKRVTKNLTPGQKYRLLFARAIAREPKVVIVDDLFNGVEAGLRKELRNEMVKLNKRLKINFIYVTDNPTDALVAADKIAFLEDGILTQYGTPSELYDKPETLAIATFFGSPKINLFQGVIVKEEGAYRLETEGWSIKTDKTFSEDFDKKYVAAKRTVTFAVRAEDFYEDENGDIKVTVDSSDEWSGGKYLSVLYSNTIEEPSYFNAFIKTEEEKTLKLAVKSDRLLIYDTETEVLVG